RCRQWRIAAELAAFHTRSAGAAASEYRRATADSVPARWRGGGVASRGRRTRGAAAQGRGRGETAGLGREWRAASAGGARGGRRLAARWRGLCPYSRGRRRRPKRRGAGPRRQSTLTEFQSKKRVARAFSLRRECHGDVTEQSMTVARRMGAAEWGFLLALTA